MIFFLNLLILAIHLFLLNVKRILPIVQYELYDLVWAASLKKKELVIIDWRFTLILHDSRVQLDHMLLRLRRGQQQKEYDDSGSLSNTHFLKQPQITGQWEHLWQKATWSTTSASAPLRRPCRCLVVPFMVYATVTDRRAVLLSAKGVIILAGLATRAIVVCLPRHRDRQKGKQRLTVC